MDIITTMRQFSQKILDLDPVRAWRLMARAFALALLVLVAWNVWIYLRVANGGVIDAAAVQTPSALDQSSLNAVHAVLDARVAEEAKYKNGVYQYSDPSQ